MVRPTSLVAPMMIVALLLAAGNAVTSDPSEPETGAVKGRVLDASFELIEGALLELVQNEQVLYSTETDEHGEYAFVDVEPGDYRLEVSAEGYYTTARQVGVVAGEILNVDFMLEEKPVPWVDLGDWSGFISCWVVGPGNCSLIDSHHETSLETSVEPGLRTASIALTWDDGQLLSAQQFRLLVTTDDGTVLADETSGSPIEIRIDDGFQGTSTLEYELEPASSLLVYQQSFTMYWAYHYWEPAPPGYSPLPDA